MALPGRDVTEEICALVDFRYLSDALRPEQALDLLRRGTEGKAERIAELEAVGYPAYATSPGWLGYSDDKMFDLCQEAVSDGFDQVKLKVGPVSGTRPETCRLAREAIGDKVALAVDANQVWDIDQAIAWVQRLSEFDLAWVEEPTFPDDILGHARIRAAVYRCRWLPASTWRTGLFSSNCSKRAPST